MIHQLYYRRFTLERVIDGDTVVGTVDNGFYTSIKQSFRLYGINAPEMNSPDATVRDAAKLATEYLTTYMYGCKWLVQSFKNPSDKYGRFLASFHQILSDDGKGNIEVGDESLNAMMVRLGYAVPYLP